MFGKRKEKEQKQQKDKGKVTKIEVVVIIVAIVAILFLGLITGIIILLLKRQGFIEEHLFDRIASAFVGVIIICLVSKLLFKLLFKSLPNESEDDLNSYYTTLKSKDNDVKVYNGDIEISDAKRVRYRMDGFPMPPSVGHTLKKLKNVHAIKKNSSDEVIAIMLGNLKEIKEYYRLSKRQAGWAFWSAIVSFFAGFVFLGVVIWILLNKSTDTLALIIPAIGTVVSELFGLTIFSVYKKSLNQLNSYYDSLHDNERFISLLYITDKLSDPMQRDELFTQIVKDQISTINRQKTKAEEQNEKKPSGKKVVLVKKNKKNNSKNP